MIIAAGWCVAAYLVGSISWSWWLVRRIDGRDLRRVGSGNLGATNAGRVLGRRWAVAIYALDLAKGAVAVLVPRLLWPDATLGGMPLELAGGGAAMLGHVFPFYLGFKGGKGVATGSGVVVALAPLSGAAAAVVWAATVRLSRMVSLGSILAALSLPVVHALLPHQDDAAHRWRLGFFAAVALLVVILHRANVARILAGNENKIGSRA